MNNIDYTKVKGIDILKTAVDDRYTRMKLARWFAYSGECVDKLMDMGVEEKDAIRALRSLLCIKNAEFMHPKDKRDYKL